MIGAREPIYLALFNLIADIPDFVTTGRRVKAYADVAASAQPAMFQQQKGETVITADYTPPKYKLRVDIIVYAYNGDINATPSTALNNLIDAVEAALQPPPAQHKQTLGGLVTHCYISGDIATDEGTLGNQAVAVIPVEILTT